MAETMPSSYHLWAWLGLCLALTSWLAELTVCVWVSPLATNLRTLSATNATRWVSFFRNLKTKQSRGLLRSIQYYIEDWWRFWYCCWCTVCIWMTGSATFIDRSIGHYCSSAVGYFICDDQGGFNLIRQDRQAGRQGSQWFPGTTEHWPRIRYNQRRLRRV